MRQVFCRKEQRSHCSTTVLLWNLPRSRERSTYWEALADKPFSQALLSRAVAVAALSFPSSYFKRHLDIKPTPWRFR